MYKVGIAGATGYTGYELLQIIHRHPELDIVWLTSEQSAGKRFSEVFAAPWDYPLIKLAEGMTRAHEVDVVESIAHVAPIILPIVGGVLMFLLAFIAVFLA